MNEFVECDTTSLKLWRNRPAAGRDEALAESMEIRAEI